MRASHMPKAFWAEHLEQIERREMSIAAYARENDISAGSLYVWRGKLRADRSSVVSQVRFAEIITSAPAPSSLLLVRIGEVTLEFDALPDATWLAELLAGANASP